MRPINFTVNLDNASATLLAVAQTTAGAANLTLTSKASAIDTSGAARAILMTTTENDSGITYIITGTDADGNVITETSTLPNSTTKASTNTYKTLTSFHVSGAVGANMSLGTLGTIPAVSKTIPLDMYAKMGCTVTTQITGTILYSVRETFDPILANGTAKATWFTGSLNTDTQNTSGTGTVGANLVSLSSANGRSQLDKGATGMDISIASYSSGATLTVNVITEGK